MTDDAAEPGDDDLRRLCEAHGIETAYDDIWGHRHEVSPEAMRALLRDMGAFDHARQRPQRFAGRQKVVDDQNILIGM